MKLGDTFEDGYDPHLRLVIAGPTPDGRVAIANFTTCTEGCDQSCIVCKGDHPYLKHDSFVYYQRASIEAVSDIQHLLGTRHCTLHQPLSNGLLKRIRDGAIASEFTDEGIRTLILAERQQGLLF